MLFLFVLFFIFIIIYIGDLMNKISIPKYSLSEKIINSIIHEIGALLSI